MPLSSFCSAATAMLQHLPLLQQAEQLLQLGFAPTQQSAAPSASHALRTAAGQLGSLVCDFACVAAAADVAVAGDDDPAVAAVAPAAWQLASCACKLALLATHAPHSAGQATWPTRLLTVAASTLAGTVGGQWPPLPVTTLPRSLPNNRCVLLQ